MDEYLTQRSQADTVVEQVIVQIRFSPNVVPSNLPEAATLALPRPAVSNCMDIEDYRQALERQEDSHDIRVLDEMRQGPLSFRKLDEFLRERGERV